MKSKFRHVLALASGLSLALYAAPASFAAATWTVTNTSDNGSGSLRAAIASAQTGDTITFQSGLSGTILLQSTLTVTSGITIQGPGASQLAVSGNNSVQVFHLGATSPVTISGLTVESGNAYFGGGIDNYGTLTLTNSTVAGNSAAAAGGIANEAYSTLTLTNSTVSGNSALGNNVSFGGGIDNYGTLTLVNSTVSGNSAAVLGGGICNLAGSGGTLTLTNSTISGNSAGSGGGGIVSTSTITLTNSTVSGNSAENSGGGILSSSLLTLKGTLLAGNGTAGNCAANATYSTSDGYNLSDDGSCSAIFKQSTDQNNTPAGLDPKALQNNGGPTQTIALLPTSPAVDAIPVANCTDTNGNPVTTDQRGVNRPQGKGCDIGAYELIQIVPFSSFTPYIAIDNGRHPGFVMATTFTLGSASTGLKPASEAMTLQIANYTLTLPAGSFHQLWNAPNAPYGYEGAVNGTNLLLEIVPLGNNTFAYDAAGAPANFSGVKNPVTITLTFGNDSGTASVNATLTNF